MAPVAQKYLQSQYLFKTKFLDFFYWNEIIKSFRYTENKVKPEKLLNYLIFMIFKCVWWKVCENESKIQILGNFLSIYHQLFLF